MPLDDDYALYHFSVTCHCSDAAVLHCLRALSQWANHGSRKPQIGLGGTSEEAWLKSSGQFTVRFTSSVNQQRFVDKANSLLGGQWTLISTSPDDPAQRQRS